MKKITLLVTVLLLGTSSFAQNTLFSDDFESGDAAWTLSVTGTNGWIVNNIYAGLAPLINDTPDQPAQISANPQSNYLHVMNTNVCNQFSVCNANYDAGTASTAYAEITNAFNTSNLLNTTISFYWLCVGAAGNSFGELEYSTDSGTTWTSTGTEYSATGTWTQESVSLPAFNGVTSLKFRFKWENNSQGSDPSFAIDALEISAEQDVTSIGETDMNIFSIAPNPAGDFIQIQSNSSEEIKSIFISSATGAIYARSLMNNTLNVADLDSGIYFLNITTASGVRTVRFVKQ